MSATAKKKRPGRPKGSTKANTKLVLIPQTRLPLERLKLLRRNPGLGNEDQLRRLLDQMKRGPRRAGR